MVEELPIEMSNGYRGSGGNEDAMSKYTKKGGKALAEVKEPSKFEEKLGRIKRKLGRALTSPFRNTGLCLNFVLRVLGLRK